MYSQQGPVNTDVRLAVKIGITIFAVAAVYCMFTAGHIHFYVLQAKPASALADPPRVGKLLWLEGLLAVTGLCFLALMRLFIRRSSPHMTLLSEMTLSSQLLWTLLIGYVLFVYYPVPPHAHHTEKVLLSVGGLFVWSVVAIFRPAILSALSHRRLLRVVKWASVNFIAFVMLGEAVFRLVDPMLASHGFVGDKQTPAHLKPHAPVPGSIGRSNAQGFRDKERTLSRGDVAIRIVSVGDSQTYGAGVTYDQTFSTLLEKRLQEGEPRSEVINLGVPGWEPPEELHLLKMYGLRFQPDLVLLNFYVGNDILTRRGAFRESSPIVVAGRSYYVHATGNLIHDTVGPDRWFLYHHINYVIQVGGVYVRGLLHPPSEESGVLGIALRTRKGYLQELDERTDIYLVQPTEEVQLQWERTKRTLAEFKQVLDARHIRLLLVLLPDHVQIDAQLRREFLEARGADQHLFDFTQPQRLLVEWSEENGVPVLDLLPIFQQSGTTQGKHYFETDLHMTESGHRLASEGIWPAIGGLSGTASSSGVNRVLGRQ
jgi:lysophospholipase L1-like esterase